MDVHRGEQFPCGNCSKLLASHRHVKGSPERLHPGVQVQLVRGGVMSMQQSKD